MSTSAPSFGPKSSQTFNLTPFLGRIKLMIIGIDASRAVKDQKTGTEWYSWYLIRELSKLDFRNNYLLYSPSAPKDDFLYDNIHFMWKIIPAQSMWSQKGLALEVTKNPPDVFFAPSHIIPQLSSVNSVMTIHGLEYKHFPKAYSLKDRLYMDFAVKQSAKKAKKIIVPSISTKNDLIKFYKTEENKIAVIPEGVDREVFIPSSEKSPMAEPYILFIGRIEERKNISMLIKAFELLCKENTPINLILIGKQGYGYDKIKEQIDSLSPKVKERIHELGYLPDDEKIKYLHGATVFAFPSLYEGFGLPILEAMACGVPVISSNTSSLPEVTGDAALTLDPNNPLAWASALSRVIHKQDERQRMIDRGNKLVGHFSWRRTAELTLDVLNNA